MKTQNCNKEEGWSSPKSKENSKSANSPQGKSKDGVEKPAKKSVINTSSEKRFKNGANNSSCNINMASKTSKFDFDEDTDSEEIPKPKTVSKNSDNKSHTDAVSSKPVNSSTQSAQMKNRAKQDTDPPPKAKMARFDSDTDEDQTDDDTKSPTNVTKNEPTTQNTARKKDNVKNHIKQCEKKANICDKNKLANKSSPKTPSSQEASSSNCVSDNKPETNVSNVLSPPNEQKCFTGNQINGFTNVHKQNDAVKKDIKVGEQEAVNSIHNHPTSFQAKIPSQTTNHPQTNTLLNHQNINIANKFNNQTKYQNKVTNKQKFVSNIPCQQLNKNNITPPLLQNCNKTDIQQVQTVTCYNEQLVKTQPCKTKCEMEHSTAKNTPLKEEDRPIEEAQEPLKSLTCISSAKNSFEKPLLESLLGKKTPDVANTQNSWRDWTKFAYPNSMLPLTTSVKQEKMDVKEEIVNCQKNIAGKETVVRQESSSCQQKAQTSWRDWTKFGYPSTMLPLSTSVKQENIEVKDEIANCQKNITVVRQESSSFQQNVTCQQVKVMSDNQPYFRNEIRPEISKYGTYYIAT